MLQPITLPMDTKELDEQIFNKLDKVFKEYQADSEEDKKIVLDMHHTVSKMMELTSTNFGTYAVVRPIQQIAYQMIEMFKKHGLLQIS